MNELSFGLTLENFQSLTDKAVIQLDVGPDHVFTSTPAYAPMVYDQAPLVYVIVNP